MKKTANKTTKNNIIIGVTFLVMAILVILVLGAKSGAGILGADAFMAKYQSTPGAILVDVRTPDEFNAGHIKNAIDIDFENPNFVKEIQTLDPSKTYFIYCRSGNRSAQADAIMKQHSFASVYELQGGIMNAPQLLN